MSAQIAARMCPVFVCNFGADATDDEDADADSNSDSDLARKNETT